MITAAILAGFCIGCILTGWLTLRNQYMAAEELADNWRAECNSHDRTRAELVQVQADLATLIAAINVDVRQPEPADVEPVCVGDSVLGRFCWN
jgi:hypothetical protein